MFTCMSYLMTFQATVSFSHEQVTYISNYSLNATLLASRVRLRSVPASWKLFQSMQTHTHSCMHRCMNARSHTHTCTHVHTHILSLSHTHTLSVSHTHTHTHTRMHTHMRTHTHAHTHSLSLSHTHTCTHTHTYLSLSLCEKRDRGNW